MTVLAEKFMELFRGMEEAHGCYVLNAGDTKKGEKAKGYGITKRQPVTQKLWDRHLDGTEMLGIIPIQGNNSCVWGAIDIDDYGLEIEVFARRVYALDIPLLPMRSKSGGCHLVMFLSEEVPASDLQLKLREIAATLGFGKSEIFPKQASVLIEKGDLGNWLNMPYYGGENSSRYALDKDGESMSPEDFLIEATKKQITYDQMISVSVETDSTAVEDGPPCLQALVFQGFPKGTRNNGLFALGVYCRKAFPDNWKDVLEQFNKKYMSPPLPRAEAQAIIKQLDKKDYNYKCRDQPICNFCNAALCRTRPHGIGSGSMPSLTSLAKIPTDQPVWFLDIDGTRMELTTDQLQIQSQFQKMCMISLNLMPPLQSARQWQSIVQTLLNDCKVLEKPKEAGLADQFVDLVKFFCSDSRLLATSRDEIILGRAWVGMHPREADQPRVYFRLKDLEHFLIRQGFRYYTRSQMISRLQGGDLLAETYFFVIRGKGTNVWHIREPDGQIESFDLPDMKGDIL